MKIKLNLEALIYLAVILLSLIVLALGLLNYQFTDSRLVYEGF